MAKPMAKNAWVDGFPGGVTVCSKEGTILEMNDRSTETFAGDGGRDLIGKNLMDCHSEKSQAIVKTLLESHETNVYTIEKNGKKKLIYQAPWYEDGQYQGIVELSLDLPNDMPHFIR